uniref:Uncharacterized protein n=2 Tax=Chrysotila carterae TaxID=13221 RepID=A0A7S4EXC0_CHRCT
MTVRQEILAMLPETILDAGGMISKNGLSESLARKSLLSFPKYLEDSRSKVSTIVAAGKWTEAGTGEHQVQRMAGIAHALVGAAGMVCAARVQSMSKRLQDTAKAFATRQVSEVQVRAATAVWLQVANELLTAMNSADIDDLVAGPEICALSS